MAQKDLVGLPIADLFHLARAQLRLLAGREQRRMWQHYYLCEIYSEPGATLQARKGTTAKVLLRLRNERYITIGTSGYRRARYPFPTPRAAPAAERIVRLARRVMIIPRNSQGPPPAPYYCI